MAPRDWQRLAAHTSCSAPVRSAFVVASHSKTVISRAGLELCFIPGHSTASRRERETRSEEESGARSAGDDEPVSFSRNLNLLRARQIQALEPIDQRAPRHAEDLRGARLVAGALLEREQDAPPLVVIFERGQTELAPAHYSALARRLPRRHEHFGR